MTTKHPSKAEVEKLHRGVSGIKNIIYNVEQNPSAWSVKDLLISMRRALGLRDDEPV